MKDQNNTKHNKEVERILKEELTSILVTDYIYIGVEKTIMPITFTDTWESIKSFEMKDSDIIVASYPRSGTTWTQEMVWLIGNALDFEGAKVFLPSRFPFIECCGLRDYKNDEILKRTTHEAHKKSLEYARKQTSPRFIKTHLPFSLLPEEIQSGKKIPKIIYVFRNPKDVCVSFFHFSTKTYGFSSTLENFSEAFLADKIMYGSYWKHVLGYWERRSNPNILCITYEDMHKDLPSVIRRVAQFLGTAVTDGQIQQLCDHLDFGAMKNNNAVNYTTAVEHEPKSFGTPEKSHFMRSGVVGQYKEELSEETISKFNEWIRLNTEGTGFADIYDYTL